MSHGRLVEERFLCLGSEEPLLSRVVEHNPASCHAESGQVEVLADMGPGKDELLWPFFCLKTLDDMTAPWALVHMPYTAARTLHALVRLLAASGASTAALNGRGAKGFETWGFMFGPNGFAAPWDEEKRREILRERAPVPQRRAENLMESALLVGAYGCWGGGVWAQRDVASREEGGEGVVVIAL